MLPKQVLIIDDEADVCTFFLRLLTRKGYGVVTASTEPEALRALAQHCFDVALVDLKLPDTDGLTLLQAVKGRQPDCEVIIMTGYSTIKTAVTAMQLGAYEYVEKPFDDIDEIEALVEKAASHGTALQFGERAHDEWEDVARAVGFHVGTSASMRRLVSLGYKIAAKNINVLIQGKTGTGKEVLSRFIHAASGRADQPFIPVNCGALPENLLESELFGHERGAFTGASQTRKGIFELANRGTLFLDEVGDASPQIQVKLLRVLETGEFMRVGGEKPIKVDVRVIAATNVDLEEAIREKTFREDLFYRLNVVRLEIPSLAERHEDIPQLAERFVRQLNPDLHMTPQALRLMQEYPWPGNIRELANIMRRAVVMCAGTEILPEHLGTLLPALQSPRGKRATQEKQELRQAALPSAEEVAAMSPDELEETLRQLKETELKVREALRKSGAAPAAPAGLKAAEADVVREALDRSGWNITEAARALGIGRNTLYRKIKRFGFADTSA